MLRHSDDHKLLTELINKCMAEQRGQAERILKAIDGMVAAERRAEQEKRDRASARSQIFFFFVMGVSVTLAALCFVMLILT